MWKDFNWTVAEILFKVKLVVPTEIFNLLRAESNSYNYFNYIKGEKKYEENSSIYNFLL